MSRSPRDAEDSLAAASYYVPRAEAEWMIQDKLKDKLN